MLDNARRHWRRIAFGLAAIGLSAIASVAAVVAIDVWLHARYARWLGYNVWGYRGPIAGRKHAGTYRVVLLGGSVAYGYAVEPSDTISAYLERDLATATTPHAFSVVNLAYNNEGAYSFQFTLRDYAYLDYDLAILFEGYNDLGDDPRNAAVFRDGSPVFRLTGYLPIFPVIFREKAAALLRGDVNSAYLAPGKPMFRPSWSSRVEAHALETASSWEQVLEHRLERISRTGSPRAVPAADFGCEQSPLYCESVAAGVDTARALGKQVLVGTQPYPLVQMRARFIRQQAEMARMLSRRYAADPNVAYINLGTSIDLSDERLSGDYMHPTRDGNARIAAALTPVVLKMARDAHR